MCGLFLGKSDPRNAEAAGFCVNWGGFKLNGYSLKCWEPETFFVILREIGEAGFGVILGTNRQNILTERELGLSPENVGSLGEENIL